jgi:hypothetical protein
MFPPLFPPELFVIRSNYSLEYALESTKNFCESLEPFWYEKLNVEVFKKERFVTSCKVLPVKLTRLPNPLDVRKSHNLYLRAATLLWNIVFVFSHFAFPGCNGGNMNI